MEHKILTLGASPLHFTDTQLENSVFGFVACIFSSRVLVVSIDTGLHFTNVFSRLNMCPSFGGRGR